MSCLSPFLKKGFISEYFRRSGKIPNESDLLHMWVNGLVHRLQHHTITVSLNAVHIHRLYFSRGFVLIMYPSTLRSCQRYFSSLFHKSISYSHYMPCSIHPSWFNQTANIIHARKCLFLLIPYFISSEATKRNPTEQITRHYFKLNVAVFWDMMQCFLRLLCHKRFTAVCCLHLQGGQRRISEFFKAEDCCKTLVTNHKRTQLHIPEDCTLS